MVIGYNNNKFYSIIIFIKTILFGGSFMKSQQLIAVAPEANETVSNARVNLINDWLEQFKVQDMEYVEHISKTGNLGNEVMDHILIGEVESNDSLESKGLPVSEREDVAQVSLYVIPLDFDIRQHGSRRALVWCINFVNPHNNPNQFGLLTERNLHGGESQKWYNETGAIDGNDARTLFEGFKNKYDEYLDRKPEILAERRKQLDLQAAGNVAEIVAGRIVPTFKEEKVEFGRFDSLLKDSSGEIPGGTIKFKFVRQPHPHGLFLGLEGTFESNQGGTAPIDAQICAPLNRQIVEAYLKKVQHMKGSVRYQIKAQLDAIDKQQAYLG